MEQNIRNDISRFSVDKNREDILPGMVFQECLDLLPYPDGLTCPGRTYDNKVIGIFDSLIYIIVKIGCDRELFLVTEDPFKSPDTRFFWISAGILNLSNDFCTSEAIFISSGACLYEMKALYLLAIFCPPGKCRTYIIIIPRSGPVFYYRR